MNRLFLLGHGIGYSRSPLLHQAALHARRIDGEYSLLDLTAPELAERLPDLLKDPGVRGFNVTVPFKEAVGRFLDGLTAEAERCGAVNCGFRDQDRWLGTNTDVIGFRAALQAARPPEEFTAGIIGTGGAARAVAVALDEYPGCREIRVWNRTASRQDNWHRQMAGRLSLPCHSLNSFPEMTGCQVLIQATSSRELIPPAEVLEHAVLFLDLIYGNPHPLRAQALSSAGVRFVDGGVMLLHQAAESFRLWFGGETPLDEMARAYYNQSRDLTD